MVADAPGRGEGRGRQAIGHPIDIWAVDGDLGWVVCQLIVAAPSALPHLFSHPVLHQHMLSASRRATSMAETTINMIDALQGQLAQLKRLLCSEDVDQRSA